MPSACRRRPGRSLLLRTSKIYHHERDLRGFLRQALSVGPQHAYLVIQPLFSHTKA